jgi:hypothetical protein
MQPRLSILNLNTSDQKEIRLNTDRDLAIELINFHLSYEAIPESELHIFYSFAANPGRYIEAIVAQALKIGAKGNFLVMNSFIDVHADLYQQALRAVENRDHEDIALIASSNDVPLGYFFGKSVFQKKMAEKLFYLRFLSVVSANADFMYLRTAFDLKKAIRFDVIEKSFNGKLHFFSESISPLYTLTTMHALLAYQKQSELPACRIAVMPYHAGDLLFFLKAFQEVSHLFNTILVHKEFVPIVQKIAPELQMIVHEEDSPGRGNNTDPSLIDYQEEAFFFRKVLYPSIPSDALFYWFRPSLSYLESKNHMIDQWKFSLTNQNFSIVRHEKREKKWQRPSPNKSILIHFDGGWSLKVYPRHLQETLIKTLQNGGYFVDVLTNKSITYSCSTITFENIQKLEKDIMAHAIFIGMDSFPAHFATHILQHPCICLFSSTRPENSNASLFDGYEFMDNHLKCCPCNRPKICPLLGHTYCKNFSSPTSILEAVHQMWHRCYESSS